jgi:glycosyltransferase involved in cell wall biosynthesis
LNNGGPTSSPDSPPPLVSVIVPARNCPDHLQQCLAAIAASTCRSFEIIVVDDASTDDTAAIAAEAGARVLRMVVRSGPAAARNHAAELAKGDILFFVDADVCLHSDAMGRVVELFETDATVDAVFGSYDLDPSAPNLISQYKNLLHRFVHQHGSEEACTFWSGCGAIRKTAFQAGGGFDAKFIRPSIEDIELGARLRRMGRRIRLDKRLQASHLKTWTLVGLLRSDVLDRALPWTRMILRERDLPSDLNLTIWQRLCAALTCLAALVLLFGSIKFPALRLIPLWTLGLVALLDRLTAFDEPSHVSETSRLLLSFGAVVMIIGLFRLGHGTLGWGAALGWIVALVIIGNLRLHAFFVRQRGLGFAVMVIPLHLAYYLYSSGALATGIAIHLYEKRAAMQRQAAGI